MKLSNKTLAVLKNFSTINNGLVVKKGKEQETVSLERNVMAKATIDQDFPLEFAIYDLNGFLSMLSTFDEDGEADIEFNDSYMIISNGPRKLKYFYAAKSVIFSPPKDLVLDVPVDCFDLPVSDLKLIQKIANFGMGDLNINSDGETLSISVSDNKETTSNELQINYDQSLPECSITFDVALMKVIESDYSVGINSKTVHFRNPEGDIQYWFVLRG